METQFAEGWDEEPTTAVAAYVPMAVLVSAGAPAATFVEAVYQDAEIVFSSDWSTEELTTIEASVPTWLLANGG